jgi:hypothetical protein
MDSANGMSFASKLAGFLMPRPEETTKTANAGRVANRMSLSFMASQGRCLKSMYWICEV